VLFVWKLTIWVVLGIMNYKFLMWLCNYVKTNLIAGNLVCKPVLKTGMNKMCSWKHATWVGLVLLVLEGHIKNVLNKVAYHMNRARFVVLGGHVENVFEYGSQPHVWGLKHEITVYAKLKKVLVYILDKIILLEFGLFVHLYGCTINWKSRNLSWSEELVLFKVNYWCNNTKLKLKTIWHMSVRSFGV